MKKWILLLGMTVTTFAQGYKVGDMAADFSLKNVNGQNVSLKDFSEAKGFIVMFTCNQSPCCAAYEERVIALDKKYAALGFPIIAVNPNNPANTDKEKGYTFQYLLDNDQSVTSTFGATKTPQIFILQKSNDGLKVAYIGAIDDNRDDASAVKVRYAEDAINSMLKGKAPKVTSTKAVGCAIKSKKS